MSVQQPVDVLEGQLRECFGRVVYTHKTHEKQADILLCWLSVIKWTQIALSAATTTGFVVTLVGDGRGAAVIGAVTSTVLLALNAYAKSHDLGGLAQKHRDTGASLWGIRERYLSLLVDMKVGLASTQSIIDRRDKLLDELQVVHASAPSTTGPAYRRAQKALQKLGDLSFSDAELDAFLPKELKRTPKPNV